MTMAATPRILMVTGAYHPEISSGGVQCRLMANLISSRAHVRVLTTAIDRALPRHDTVDQVPVVRVHVDVTSLTSRLRAAAVMASELVRLIAAVDVVHVHGCSTKNIPVALLAKVLRRRMVLSLHTAGFDEPEAVKRQGALAWWAFTSAALCLSVSQALAQRCLDAGLPPGRVRHVPNGIDTRRFRPASADERAALRVRLGLPATGPIVLFVGFFSHDKQPQVAFDVWLQLQRLDLVSTLLFVGATTSPYFEVDNDLAGGMVESATREGLAQRLVMTGTVQNIEDYYRAADLFILTSRREGLPVALLEAMACALPCVASHLPGSTDTIIADGGNGLLVAPGDTARFAQQTASLLHDRARASMIGAAARQTVLDRFSGEQVAQRWLEAYELVAAETS